ncbi:MAG: Gfo/Idh/MocA family oxidoreductase [Candidatus Adiutrix sp.]
MKNIKNPQLALVGLGYWGQNLLRNFCDLKALKTVFDPDKEAIFSVLKNFPELGAAPSWQSLLEDSTIAAVVLATPPSTHFQLAWEALKAGKHVFVEKPLSMSTQEGRKLLDLASSLGLVLMVDHLLQNHPAYIALRQMVQDGCLGRIRHLQSRRQSYGRFVKEGVLWSFAPHDVSMVMGLMGEAPTQVQASGTNFLGGDGPDVFEGSLFWDCGAMAHISVSWLNPVKEHRLIVSGEKAMAVFDDTLPWGDKLKIYHHEVNWVGPKPVAKAKEATHIPLEKSEPLASQCFDFIQAITLGHQTKSCGAEALRGLVVLEALDNSLAHSGLRQRPRWPNNYFAHPTAIIDPEAVVSDNCKIWHFSHVLKGSVLGQGTSLGQNVVVGPNVKVGCGVKIQNNVSVYEGVEIGDYVFCGPSVVFTNVINPRAHIVRKNEYRPTKVKSGATIGANATIVCGHTLGHGCFIGAGAVLTRDVPDYALMVGAPARQIGWVCACGLKLPANFLCSCGAIYEKTPSGLCKI